MSMILMLKAFEPLQPNDIVRLYYGKVKKVTAENQVPVGIVAPLPYNGQPISKDAYVAVIVYGGTINGKVATVEEIEKLSYFKDGT